MTVRSISLPQKLDLENVFRFALDLDDCQNCKQLNINMGENRWFPPFAMLFIAMKIKQFKLNNPSLNTRMFGHHNHTYAAHLGFFSACGADFGRGIGEAWGSQKYLPITRISKGELYQTEADKYAEIQDLIQKQADKISEILSRDFDRKSEFYDVFTYSLRELMRNTFEHSNTNEIFYCIQYWPTRSKIELSIADCGIGVREALSENPNFRNLDDKQALEMSLMPTVSGKIHAPRTSEIWFNSGYGLFMTSELARNGGNFAIVSGNSGIYLSQKTKTNYVTSYSGTAIRINLDVSKIGTLSSRIGEFKAKGAKIAAQLSGSAKRPPSAMSLLIRRDFL